MVNQLSSFEIELVTKQKWLREAHNIDVSISAGVKGGYYYTLYLNKECVNDSEIKYSTYEEALENAVQRGFKLLP